MKCEHCNGTGKIESFLMGKEIVCPKCHGTGELPITNEEWLKSLNTEQLAKLLFEISNGYKFIGLKIADPKYQDMAVEDIPREWLKAPHKEEKE